MGKRLTIQPPDRLLRCLARAGCSTIIDVRVGRRTALKAIAAAGVGTVTGTVSYGVVYAILGNHDDDRDMPAALTAKHIQVLKDARTRLEIRGEGLELAGIRFWTRKSTDIARVVSRARDTVLLLAHDPRRLDEAVGLDVPAVLSGHTHGGQVVIPGFG